MNIQHEDSKTKGAFFIEKDGERAAELTYSKMGDFKIILDHTEVNDSYKGEGLGKALVYHAAEFARENDLKILPLCPFARAIMSRNKEDFKDVI